MARALLARLRCERRTSLGAPVEPEVLNRRASSGCSSRSRAGRRRSMSHRPAVGVDHRIGLPHAGQVLVVGAREQGNVVAFEQRQVGDHELDGVAGLQDHERSLGEAELVALVGRPGRRGDPESPPAVRRRARRTRRDRHGAARPTPVHP